MFEDLKRNGSLLRTSDSASILVALLRKQNFKTGDHVDYYDDICKDASQPAAGATAAGAPWFKDIVSSTFQFVALLNPI